MAKGRDARRRRRHEYERHAQTGAETAKRRGKAQPELDEREYEFTAGGAVVRAKVNGKLELLELQLAPEAVDPEDVQMLSDTILAAVNGAAKAARADRETSLGKISGGMNIPDVYNAGLFRLGGELVEQFESLPGIGHKTAQRLAFYGWVCPGEQARAFADAIVGRAGDRLPCRICCNLSDSEVCPICESDQRIPR
jgi:DNA-binding protein YbaB